MLSNLLFHYSPYKDSGAGTAISGDSSSGTSVATVIAALYKPMHVIRIFKYGLMTMGQIIPGFISFALSRYALIVL